MMGLLGEHPGNPAARKIAQSHLPSAMELEQTARTLREFPGNTPQEVEFRNKLIDRLMRFSKEEADESGIGFAASRGGSSEFRDEVVNKAKAAQRAAKAGIDRRMGQISDELINLENNRPNITPEQYEKLKKELIDEVKTLDRRRLKIKQDAASKGTMDPDDYEGAPNKFSEGYDDEPLDAFDELDIDEMGGAQGTPEALERQNAESMTEQEFNEYMAQLDDLRRNVQIPRRVEHGHPLKDPYRNIRNMRTSRKRFVQDLMNLPWDPRSGSPEATKRIAMVEAGKAVQRAREAQERSMQGGVEPQGYDDGSIQILMSLAGPFAEASQYLPEAIPFTAAQKFAERIPIEDLAQPLLRQPPPPPPLVEGGRIRFRPKRPRIPAGR